MSDAPDDPLAKLLHALEGLPPRRNSGRYILNAAGDPEPCDDLLQWALWMEHGVREVAQDMDEGAGRVRGHVSTVFLGLDMNPLGDPPLLFETMVFGGPLDGARARYATRAEALAGHQAMCQRVSGPKPPTP